jgi:UDP-glucose:(heptosyl)LPS alpha-1,3-glucosyltransferase
MKIALVILHADPTRGGAERYTIDLANALAKRGQTASLIASDSIDVSAFRVVALPAPGFTRTGRYKAFLRALDVHLRSESYDIVHAMLPVPTCDLYHPHAGIAAEGVKRWNAVFNPRRRAMAHVERSLLTGPHPPVVLCLSEYVKRFVRQHYPLPEERLVRLFNAVDLERFVPQPKREADGWINALIIAQDYERKGLREAIKALSKAQDARLRLLVVGKQDPAAYASLARQLGVAERVVFHPPTTQPQAVYAQADFFVLPTKHDPCSLVVLEALAMGLPVISTMFNGATEIMIHGTHGFVLPDPADVSALAQAMNDLSDEARRAEMSRACLALRPHLAFEHHLDELLAIYQRICR